VWKVQKLADGEFVVLSLSGRLEGEELTDLERVIASEAHNRSIVLDLKDVKLVDQDSVTFLARCEARGTKLRNCPAYIRQWITKHQIG
jgi:anti-anti-sigma regulatory factor